MKNKPKRCLKSLVSLTALSALLIATVTGLSGCSSGPAIKKQQYANLQTSKVLEYDFEQVWKGIGDALAEYRLKDKDDKDGTLSTDWVYSTSSDKYISVMVNQQPRRKYLQARYRFHILAKRQIIGVLVDVKMDEEVEQLSSEGAFQSWKSIEELDTKRAHDILEKIELRTHERTGR